MKWREPITLTVRILSPVVIGTGEKCNTLGFITDDGKVLVVDERKFFAALSEPQRERFLSWIEPLVGNLAHIRQQIQRAGRNQALRQQFGRQRREAESNLSLKKFLRENLRMLQPAQWLRSVQALRYEVAAVTPPNRYEGFTLCLKTPDHRPYIPGSELKGAIRTAVLAKMLNDDVNLLRQLAQNLRPNMTKGQMNALWQGNEWLLLRRNQNDRDAHNDLFRGIAISDSEPLPTDALHIYAAKRLNMSSDVTVFVEAIAPNSETKVTLSVACPDRWLDAIGLTDKAGWLDWEKLAQALHEHAKAVLDFIAEKFPQVKKKAQWLKQQNKPQAPLVCLGWGQGFLSITMTEPLRQKFPTAYETLRQALAQAIGHYGRTQPNNFPKTLWVALDRNGQPSDLFGWVQLVAR
ncbi:MAG: type III-A CRISPR-associated RAMP protein Csm5 [Armatimonadota bacterium]|nr:type III-A CRISPR-associated RAMP protein Csm5 [Armatimonadota bacterium]